MNHLEAAPLAGGAPKKLVVFLHGLGSDGADLMGLVPYFAPSLRDAHFYSPNGLEKCDLSPFGYQWFSLQNRDPHVIIKEVEQAAPKILDMIDEKLTWLNLTFEDLIVIGFSQGTMTGLYLTHAFDICPAAMIGFSGAFLPPETVKNTNTPIALIHGMADEVVQFSSMEHAESRLRKCGVKHIETMAIPNLGHTIDLAGLKFASDFINKYTK